MIVQLKKPRRFLCYTYRGIQLLDRQAYAYRTAVPARRTLYE
jgi:hypothetical protein